MLHGSHADTPPPSDAPLVYLHGWLGSIHDWDTVRPHLPGLALDLPGHGGSRGLPDAAYTLAGAADAVVVTLDALGLDGPVLVGYSMGGRVAMTVALRHPSRLRGLVLESASPGLRSAHERAERLAVDRARAEDLMADPAGFLRDWYRMPLFASLAEEPGRLEATIAERLRGDPAELAQALRGLSVGHQPSYWDYLADLPPTLALAGALDAAYLEVTRVMGEAAPVTPHVVPEAGHNIHRECPAAFVEALRPWLARLG
jgi:2-succinyl-6-hydroxy-2,4-cyclohexadiene-1-carboxylate synthase